MTLDRFHQPGKVSFIIGGQFGSEGKGAAAAFVAATLADRGQMFDIITTNNGVQSGHTSIHKGVKRVSFHLPTIPQIAFTPMTIVYLNSGAVIDVDVLLKEIDDNRGAYRICIHPQAAVITDEDRATEGGIYSSTTRIASTRKGVGATLAARVMRRGRVARDEPRLRPFIGMLDLNWHMSRGASVCVEVPQGQSLSLSSRFYPYTTSRNCTIQQAAADADIHPTNYGQSLMILRTFPIRVGAIVDENGGELGTSGGCYPDQEETTWSALGVEPEITTVTKRVRRVFTHSHIQILESYQQTMPDVVFISFCDYSREAMFQVKNSVEIAASRLHRDPPEFLYGYGPAVEDVRTGDQRL